MERVDHTDPSDLAAIYQPAGKQRRAVKAMAVADDQHTVCGLHCVHHARAFVDGDRHRLLSNTCCPRLLRPARVGNEIDAAKHVHQLNRWISAKCVDGWREPARRSRD